MRAGERHVSRETQGKCGAKETPDLVQLLGSPLASRVLLVPRVRVYFARARVFESTRSLVLMEDRSSEIFQAVLSNGAVDFAVILSL